MGMHTYGFAMILSHFQIFISQIIYLLHVHRTVTVYNVDHIYRTLAQQ